MAGIPVGSLLKRLLEEAKLYVSCSLDSANILDSRQNCLPGDQDCAAEANEGNETKPSLRYMISPKVLGT